MSEKTSTRGWLKARRSVILSVLTGAVIVITIFVVLRGQQLTPFESVVAQATQVLLSVYGGYVFSSKSADREIRSAARKSVRRVIVNYATLEQTADSISYIRASLPKKSNKENEVSVDVADTHLKGLADLVHSQLHATNAVVEDWKDLAEEEVEQEIKKSGFVETGRLTSGSRTDRRQGGSRPRRPRPRTK